MKYFYRIILGVLVAVLLLTALGVVHPSPKTIAIPVKNAHYITLAQNGNVICELSVGDTTDIIISVR